MLPPNLSDVLGAEAVLEPNFKLALETLTPRFRGWENALVVREAELLDDAVNDEGLDSMFAEGLGCEWPDGRSFSFVACICFLDGFLMQFIKMSTAASYLSDLDLRNDDAVIHSTPLLTLQAFVAKPTTLDVLTQNCRASTSLTRFNLLCLN